MAFPRDIVFASLVEWGRMPYWRWRSLFRTATAAGHQVIWVDAFSTSQSAVMSALRAPLRLRAKLREEEPGLHRLESSLRTGGAGPLAGVAVQQVRAATRRLGFERPLLWIAGPDARALIGRLGEAASLYDCSDDLENVGAPPRLVQEERNLIGQVDVVWACSDALVTAKQGLGTPVFCVPNGVDPDHFARPGPPGPIARSLMGLPGPLVFYHGVIYDRIDWELVVSTCLELADWSFAFVGSVAKAPPAEVAELANVHLLGPAPYEEMPAVYAAADVCWVPHRRNLLTERQSSLKLLEYLAAGRPVVTTELPVGEELRGVVNTAAGRDMSAALRRAAGSGSDSELARSRRRAAAAGSSWQTRFGQIRAQVAPLVDS